MKHPSQEEWISYLYGETPTDERNTLDRHLKQCDLCRQQVNQWKATMIDLSQWELPGRKAQVPVGRRSPLTFAVIKWAAAATLMVGISYGAGRLSVSPDTLGQMRAEIEKDVREQLRAEWKGEWAGMLAEAQKLAREDAQSKAQRDIAAAAGQMQQILTDYDEKRLQEYKFVLAELKRLDASHAWLRRELETVALATEFGLKRAQAQLVQLAGHPGISTDESGDFPDQNDNTN